MGALATNLILPPGPAVPDLIAQTDDSDLHMVRSGLTPAGDNLAVIPGPAGMMPAGWLRPAAVKRLVDPARRPAGVVVLNIPPTVVDLQFDLLNGADEAVLVGQQSIAAVRCLKPVMDNLGPDRAGGRTAVALNMSDPTVQGLTAADVQAALGLPGVVTVPRDTASVLAAVNRGQPLRAVAPQSPVLKVAARLADQVAGRGKPAGPAGAGAATGPGIFGWLRRRPDGGK